MKQKSTQKQKIEVPNWLIAIIILQTILIIGIVVPIVNNSNQIGNINEKVNAIDSFFTENAQGYNSPKDSTKEEIKTNNNEQKSDVSADDDPYLGNKNAKVTVIEFSDYQCPFCRKYWTESYPKLKEEYIDTGKIKYVFRDFPLDFHPGAPLAAIAGNCIREQQGNEGYFEFHDIVFAEQNKKGTGTIQFDEEDVFSWVNQIDNLDQQKFTSCYNDPNQKAEVEADFVAGQKAGVSGTPTFFINGKKLTGAQPYSVIKAEIEKALNE